MTRPAGSRRWSTTGSVAVAVLGAVALAVTVVLAQRTLALASEVVVRGEADLVLSLVLRDLAEEGASFDEAALGRALDAHRERGLRGLSLGGRGGRLIRVGEAPPIDGHVRPGETQIFGDRIRAAAVVPPRLLRDLRDLRGEGPRGEGRPFERRHGALLVVELEPPILARLQAGLARIAFVAAGAAIALVAFAIALARSARRLAAIEERAAREARLVALGSMSSVLAHEIRNPLASLKGHAQLLVEDLEDPRRRGKAQRVVDEAERLELLTTNLLDFVRDGVIERSPIGVADLVARATEGLPRDRIDVEASIEGLDADPVRLPRALQNLLSNALEASPNDASVTLTIARAAGFVELRVRDRGPGLPPGTEIFEPFVTTRVRGTGLGLPIARRIAEQHGGSLVAEDHPEGGALFTLRIPEAR